jgi:hypothetical protein
MRFTRRQVLATGAGAAVAAGGALALPSAAEADVTNPAAVPDGPALINVGNASYQWRGNVINQDTSTTVQSFAFHSGRNELFAIQVAGASEISYLKSGTEMASTTLTGDQHADAGDLCLTKHTIDATSSTSNPIAGRVYLLGFGHGVSIGVQPITSTTDSFVWAEAGARLSGYGGEIVRFKFSNGTVLWPSHPAVQRFAGPPVPEATALTPSVDFTNNLLVIRYAASGGHYFAAYDLTTASAAIAAGAVWPTPLAVIRQPVLYKADAEGNPTTQQATFQGFTSYGRYLYMLDGDARTSAVTDPLDGVDKWTIHTTSMDINGVQNDTTTGYILRTHSEADSAATPREPEGMAIYTGSIAPAPKLCFGITDNDGSTRRFDVYSKN